MLSEFSVWIHAHLFSLSNLDIMAFVSKISKHFDFDLFSKFMYLVVCFSELIVILTQGKS